MIPLSAALTLFLLGQENTLKNHACKGCSVEHPSILKEKNQKRLSSQVKCKFPRHLYNLNLRYISI